MPVDAPERERYTAATGGAAGGRPRKGDVAAQQQPLAFEDAPQPQHRYMVATSRGGWRHYERM